MTAELKEIDGGKLLEIHLTGQLLTKAYAALVPAGERMRQQPGKIPIPLQMRDSTCRPTAPLWAACKVGR